jgi:xylan 1,4-beta-xylosidase
MFKLSDVAGAVVAVVVIAGVGSSVFAANYNLTVNGTTKQGEVVHFWSRCVGTGGAQLCVDKDWKAAAKLGVKEAGFKAFRGHRILSYSNPINWNGSGTPTYNWAKFDEVYDFLVDTLGTEPIVELSAQPRALETSGEWSPPKNLSIYQDMIKNVVAHCIERYGMERVSKWYWEVWNEWDYSGFWSNGTEQKYYDMYKAAVLGATAAYPDIKIGGPSSTGSNRDAAFLNYCKSNNVKVDLVSNHNYGGGGSGPNADPSGIAADSRSRENAIKNFGKPLVSMNTEFNTSYSGQGGGTGANLISMDSHVNAPFVAKVMKLHLDDALSNKAPVPYVMSYWAISDVFDEGSWYASHSTTLFGQVFGLINQHGIPKATFNAYKMLNMMGTTRLSLTGGTGTSDGVDGFATISSDTTEVAVMVYNFYKQLSGQTAVDDVNLTVNDIPLVNGKVEVRHYRVDSLHSNAYGVWLKLGRPQSTNASAMEQIRAASNLALLNPVDTIDFSGAAYSVKFSLPRQGLSLILLKSLAPTGVETGMPQPVRPVLAITGTTLINGGNEMTVSMFSMDGKLIKTFSTKETSVDLRKTAGCRGVGIVRVRSGGKVLTSKVAGFSYP